MSTTWRFVSSNNQYCLSAEMTGGMTFEAEEFTLREGNTAQYHIHNPGVHTFFVTDHGTVFALGERIAVFYDRTGECDTLKETVYLNNSGFTENEDIFYLSMRDGMYVYTLDGALLYTLTPGRLLVSTERGEHIAVVSADTLRLYTEGALAHMIFLETPYAHGMSFTEHGTVCVEEIGGMEIFDVVSGRKVE